MSALSLLGIAGQKLVGSRRSPTITPRAASETREHPRSAAPLIAEVGRKAPRLGMLQLGPALSCGRINSMTACMRPAYVMCMRLPSYAGWLVHRGVGTHTRIVQGVVCMVDRMAGWYKGMVSLFFLRGEPCRAATAYGWDSCWYKCGALDLTSYDLASIPAPFIPFVQDTVDYHIPRKLPHSEDCVAGA